MQKVVKKPWGQEIVLVQTDKYVLKRIVLHADRRTSLQYHECKKESIMIEKGLLRVEYGNNVTNLSYGEVMTLEPTTVHRMSAMLSDCVYLEVSTPELNDVVRVEDDFGRDVQK